MHTTNRYLQGIVNFMDHLDTHDSFAVKTFAKPTLIDQ